MIHSTIPKYLPYLKAFFQVFISDTDDCPMTIKRWTRLVITFATQCYPNDLDAQNKFKGDMLEILAEYWFSVFGPQPSIGLLNYKPAAATGDFGVDGTGINVLGHQSVVQVKFRSNPLEILTYADLAKTYADGIDNHDLKPKTKGTVWLFTNAGPSSDGDAASSQAHQFFGEVLHVIDRQALVTCLDGNKVFWQGFSEQFN